MLVSSSTHIIFFPSSRSTPSPKFTTNGAQLQQPPVAPIVRQYRVLHRFQLLKEVGKADQLPSTGD